MSGSYFCLPLPSNVEVLSLHSTFRFFYFLFFGSEKASDCYISGFCFTFIILPPSSVSCKIATAKKWHTSHISCFLKTFFFLLLCDSHFKRKGLNFHTDSSCG